MEKETGFKLGKDYVKVIYCHPACVVYMKSTSCKMLDGKTQAGIKIAGRNINNIVRRRYNSMAESKEGERGESQSWHKTTFIKLRSWHPGSSLHGK